MSFLATRLARFSSVSSLNSTDVPAPRAGRGHTCPDFALRDQFGQDVMLSSYAGQKAVALVFFPWAFSNVCTGEMSGIRDRLDEFMTFDTEVLAISTDPTYSLRVFADTDGLNFPLLSDFWPHGAVASAYGVFDAELGRGTALVVRRSTGTGSCAGRCTTSCPTGAISGSTWLTCTTWPRPVGPFSFVSVDGCWHVVAAIATVLPVEPLVTRDASGSTLFCPALRGL